ncbi:MAG: thiamine phosphate synthase [Alphaproteobacteria bacterium]
MDRAEDGGCRLYLITPAALDPEAFADVLGAALDGGDVACVQLRLKELEDDAFRRAIERLMPVSHARDVAFIVNDRPDLAAEMGCDGAHVGQQDAPYAEARRLLGPDAIVGVTCHDSRHLAMEAADAGADYVAFGAFYATSTKPSRYRPGPDILEAWTQVTTVPCVAIGGIKPENCAPLVRAGADFLAVVTGVWDHPAGPGAAVAAYEQAIREAGTR